MPIATCSKCGTKIKVAGDRVGGFVPCPKCGQTQAVAEHRVEPSAEHSLMSSGRTVPPRHHPPSALPVVAVSVATAAILIFLVLAAVAPHTAAAVESFVGSPVLTNILLCVIAALLWNGLKRD